MTEPNQTQIIAARSIKRIAAELADAMTHADNCGLVCDAIVQPQYNRGYAMPSDYVIQVSCAIPGNPPIVVK